MNAHWQNGHAEKRIRDLSDDARTSLLHASQRWRKAVTINLWQYTLRHAGDVRNKST